MKRILIIGIMVIALVSITVMKLLSNQEESKSKIYTRDKNKNQAVEVTLPELYSFAKENRYQGVFEGNRINFIASELGGKIISIEVNEGDFIKNGQIIATIDHEMIDIQMEGILLNIDQLNVDKKRLKELVNSNIVAKSEIEKIELGLKTAENQLKLLQKQLKSSVIKAPYSGIVTKQMINMGSVIGPGTPVIELLDLEKVKFNFMVPENEVLNFSKGDEIEVTCDVYKDELYKGIVNYVSAKADNAHNYKIQLIIDNSSDLKIKSGMYGKIRLKNNTNNLKRICIPRIALLGSIQKPEVYKVVKGKAKRIGFVSGESDSKYIEVLSGIELSDSIVCRGQINLTDNANIKIVK